MFLRAVVQVALLGEAEEEVMIDLFKDVEMQHQALLLPLHLSRLVEVLADEVGDVVEDVAVAVESGQVAVVAVARAVLAVENSEPLALLKQLPSTRRHLPLHC